MLPKIITERIDYVFTNMDDAVCITGMDGRLMFANPAADRLFGFPDKQGVKIWDTIPYVEENDALIQLFIDAVMNKKKSIHEIVGYINNAGEKFQLNVSLTFFPDAAGSFIFVISDLTQMVRVRSAFERYTSPDIADYVLTVPEGEKQGGQTREVSILMSDLRGFTAISAGMSSADLIYMLNHYFELIDAVIERHHGTIIEFLGDGIFVVFGAPADLPDHASAAVHCAVEMQNTMAAVNEWNREQGLPELEMGIGIHSGPAAVGNIGSEKKMKYGCMGETVNLAGRLESLTVGGDICISESTALLISEKLTIAGEKSFMPKGAKQEMKYYDVAGIGGSQVHGRQDSVRWIEIPGGTEIVFYELKGKTVDMHQQPGRLLRISSDEKTCILATETELAPMQNLMLRIRGRDVYAKVQGPEEEGYRLNLTSRTEEMTKWLTGKDPEEA